MHGGANHASSRNLHMLQGANSRYFTAPIKQVLLTVEKKCKKNVFSGRILEIEGLPDLMVEQAFELSDAAAERSAAACAVALNKESIVEYMRSNVTLMKWMTSIAT